MVSEPRFRGDGNADYATISAPANVLYFRWIEGLRGIRHTNGTQSRLTRGRHPRARRPTTRRAVSAASPDLAARLRLCQVPLRRQLSRADALAEMIRAVNASLDPVRVAEA